MERLETRLPKKSLPNDFPHAGATIVPSLSSYLIKSETLISRMFPSVHRSSICLNNTAALTPIYWLQGYFHVNHDLCNISEQYHSLLIVRDLTTYSKTFHLDMVIASSSLYIEGYMNGVIIFFIELFINFFCDGNRVITQDTRCNYSLHRFFLISQYSKKD